MAWWWQDQIGFGFGFGFCFDFLLWVTRNIDLIFVVVIGNVAPILCCGNIALIFWFLLCFEL